MREGLFWLDDLQWSSIRSLLPGRKRRGPRRVDDRRVISGIIHVLQSGMRWRDCPEEYGPPTTIYNRWHRWSQQGLWQRMFKELRSDCRYPLRERHRQHRRQGPPFGAG